MKLERDLELKKDHMHEWLESWEGPALNDSTVMSAPEMMAQYQAMAQARSH